MEDCAHVDCCVSCLWSLHFTWSNKQKSQRSWPGESRRTKQRFFLMCQVLSWNLFWTCSFLVFYGNRVRVGRRDTLQLAGGWTMKETHSCGRCTGWFATTGTAASVCWPVGPVKMDKNNLPPQQPTGPEFPKKSGQYRRSPEFGENAICVSALNSLPCWLNTPFSESFILTA